jgi:hypothetical protein
MSCLKQAAEKVFCSLFPVRNLPRKAGETLRTEANFIAGRGKSVYGKNGSFTPCKKSLSISVGFDKRRFGGPQLSSGAAEASLLAGTERAAELIDGIQHR